MRRPFQIFSQKFNWAVLALLTGLYGAAGAETSKDNVLLVQQLTKSRQAYASIRDYTALFIKQERADDKLDPSEEIFLKFEKPFKIYMKWLNKPKKGLEVHYERGKHQGKLAIHKPGFLTGLAGAIFLEQDSPWVRKGSESYNIEDAGIGTFLYDFTQAVLAAEKTGSLSAHEDSLGRWDVTFNVPAENETYFAKRCVVAFDEKSKLPVRMELFDWQGQMIGIYDYKDLKLNVGSLDPEFKKHINRSLFKVYSENSARLSSRGSS